MRSAGIGRLRTAAGGELRDERLAQFRTPAAAIGDEEARERADLVHRRPIDDRAAVPLGRDEAGPREDAEMGRHRVLRHIKQPRNFARRYAPRFVPNDKAKGLEPRRLGQGGKRLECV